MTREQFLLIKLSEECAEVSQRALKQVQFGSGEIQKDQPSTNAERLVSEIIDLISIVKLLDESGALPIKDVTADEFDAAFEAKKKKLQKYVDYSHTLGVLPEIKI